MLKNKNHFEIGERRVVWKEAVKNVAQEVETSSDAVIEAQKSVNEGLLKLKEAEKIKIIYRSANERKKFAESIADADGNADAIAKLIQNEIDNELFEDKMDAAAKDYEGRDRTNKQRDENKTRDIIENAFEKSVAGLNPTQRKQLEDFVEQKLKSAFLNDTAGKTSWWESTDSRVMKAEAEKIAEFIVEEAGKMEKGEDAVAKKETDQPQTADEKIAAATEELGTPIEIADWANGKETDGETFKKGNIKEGIAKKAFEGKEWKKFEENMVSIFENYGIDKEKARSAIKYFVALQPTWFFTIDITKLTGTENKKNTEPIKNRLEAFDNYFATKKEQVDDFFKLRSISKTNLDLFVRYFAFNDVEKDLKSFEEFEQARVEKEKENGETIEIKEREVKIKEVETDESDPEDAVAKTLESANGAMKTFGECFEAVKEGKWGEAFSKLLEAFGQIFKAFIDGSAHLWNSLAVQIPDSALDLPLIGGLLKEIKKKAKESNENKKKLDLAPITSALGIKPEEYSKAESLTITVEDFLKEKADGMKKYAEDKGITLDTNKLETLRDKLKTKKMDMTPEEKKGTVFNFLKKKIKNNPEYLQ